MSPRRDIFRWWTTKNRLSFRDGHGDRELWYMYISPLNIFTGALALVLILFVGIMILVAYTPILDFIPGYPGNRSREMLIDNIMRLDSMERELKNIQIYSDNMALVLEGKVPTTRGAVQQIDTARLSGGRTVPPDREDSLLRREIETRALAVKSAAAAGRKASLGVELLSPVSGVVTARFDPKNNRFGAGIATASDQPVAAVAAGTVTLSLWTPNDGYIIQVQHPNNLVSVYRHCTQSLKVVGARVNGGEVLSYTGEAVPGEGGKGLFHLELWFNGAPVDPESYILFR
ncbi:peptidase M23 [Bacteroidia bacterium]|nr:peptidase M23 [Bacteroidia bacterium]